MPRMLMVTPYPPQPDGIAAYAAQTVQRLRAAGDEVEVLSPGPSAAHHHLDLQGPRGALALAKRVRRYDRVSVQFHPEFFYRQPISRPSIVKESLALLAVAKAARHIEVRVHEIDYRWGRRLSFAGWATRRFWAAVDTVTVHTERERADFIKAFGVKPRRVRVVDHGSDFIAHTTLDRTTARETLGIAPDAICLLSIGFIQRHKGFDRAVRAFQQLTTNPRARLDVVGAVRLEDAANLAYLAELEALIDETPGAHLHAGFVSDESFDRWITASDVIVLPYRDIWSSGVLERALLLNRPVIATDVGGLREQAADRPGVTIVEDDVELTQALAQLLGPDTMAMWTQDASWPSGVARADEVQALISGRATARRGRPIPVVTVARQTAPAARRDQRLRSLAGLGLPTVQSDNPLASTVKRVVRRLTAWQVDPIIHQVNALHQATQELLLERSGEEGSTPTTLANTSVAPDDLEI